MTAPQVAAGHAYLEGTLTVPPDSQAANDTIDRARAAVHAVPGADAKVGGNTAVNLDIQRAAGHDSAVIIPLTLGIVLLILMGLLRAVVAPLILLGTVVLSFGAALGVSALAFDHVFGFAGADTSFPLFVFVFLVALGIDYNIFLMTRIREEAERSGPRRGALAGLAATGGVDHIGGTGAGRHVRRLGTLPVTASRYASVHMASTAGGSAQFLDADQVARGIAEGAVANAVRLRRGSWTTSASLACSRSKVSSRSLVARRIHP